MLFGPQNSAEIRDDGLTDIANEAAKFGLTENIEPGSDNHVWMTGMAGALMFAHARIDSIKSAITPIDATGDDLIRYRDALRLPEVSPSPGAGKLVLTVTGTGAMPDGAVFVYPNGLQGKVVGTWTGVTDGSEVDVVALTTGEKTNLGPGETVRFLNPPLNVGEEARVSGVVPITGGFDAEDEPRMRERVLNRFGHVPGGGNVGQIRELAFNASPAVQQPFVFPAIGGPASAKVVALKKFDRERFDFSRVMPSAGVDLVRDAIHEELGTAFEIVVTSGANQNADVAITVDIPDAVQAGGNGEGWSDLQPWPTLTGPETRIVLTSVSTAGILTVDADTTTAPIAGQTHVAWWSPNDLQFHTRLVTAVSGSAGAWVLTLESPFVDGTGEGPDAGDYLSPAAVNLDAYGATWVGLLEQLGCGENTTEADSLPRALRHPYQSEAARSGLTMFQLKELMSAHAEIVDAAYSYRSATAPTVPASIDDAPNVLTPRHLGIYPA